MSKLLIIILSQNDTEIKQCDSQACIIGSLKNGKLENKVNNNAIIVYRNAKRKNNIISDADKIIQIKEYVNSYNEVVVLYHSLFEDDFLEFKKRLGHYEKYKNIAIYSSQTDEPLFKNIVDLLKSLSKNKDVNGIFDDIWNKNVKKNNENREYFYRYEILLPFVFLHFGVQLQHRLPSKEKCATIFCDKMTQDSDKESDKVNECCTRGIKFLSENGIELNNKFRELVKSSFTDKAKITPKIKNDIEGFIRLCGRVLRYAFLELTGDKKALWNMIDRKKLPPYTFLGFTGKIKSINPLLTDIEKIFDIVDNGVAYYKKAIELNYIIRHDLERNAILRLDHFKAIQFPEQLKSLKMELNDLKIKFNTFAGQNIDEYFQVDFKEEIGEVLKVIHGMQEEISTGLDNAKILNMRNDLVCLLQKFIEKTLTIAPKDRK